MIQAAQKSTNTYFLLLSAADRPVPDREDRRVLGLYDAQNGQPLEQVVSMTLGVGYVTPVQLSGAYAAFAARMYCKPWLITAIKGPNGKAMTAPGAECKQALAPRSPTASTPSCTR